MIRKYLHRACNGGTLLLASSIAMAASAHGQSVGEGGARSSASSTPAAALVANDSELDAVVTRVAKAAVDRVALLEGQSRSRSVVASVDLAEKFVIVRLDAGFVPAS